MLFQAPQQSVQPVTATDGHHFGALLPLRAVMDHPSDIPLTGTPR